MEVPGEMDAAARSKESGYLCCQQCDVDGRQVAAQGYCQDCNHHLCQKCYDFHTSPLPLRHHRLLGAKDMPKSAAVTGDRPVQSCTITCPQHSSRIVEFYCTIHDAAMCGTCAHKHHGPPCKTEDISEVSDNYRQTTEYNHLRDVSAQFVKTAQSLQQHATTNTKNAEQSSEGIDNELDELRDKLVSQIDNVVKSMKDSQHETVNNNTTYLHTMKAECESIESELKNQVVKWSNYEKNNCDLYVASRKGFTFLKTIKQRLESAANQNKTYTYRLLSNSSLEKALYSGDDRLGSIQVTEQIQNVNIPVVSRPVSKQRSSSHMSDKRKIISDLSTAQLWSLLDINVEEEEDEHECDITGAAFLSTGRLLLADNNNNSVKCVDTTTNTLINSKLKLSSQPWDVTSLYGGQAAVTLPGARQVQVISTRDDLSLRNTFSVDGECRGISSIRDKLVITYTDPPKVEILDHQGGVLHTFQHDSHSQPLFEKPEYVAVRREGSQHMIYVSDWRADKVVKMTETGEILLTYTHPDLDGPYGVTVTDQGQLLICSYFTNQLKLMSPSGKRTSILLKENNGLSYPQTVSVCQEEKKLYISQRGENVLKVYQIK